ncbi:hypothetical protein KQH82_07880 [bacterium]|nr:hypothetical protein [bacterium]
MSQPTGFWQSIYVKFFVGAVLGFVGIAGGIYVGNAMVNRPAEGYPVELPADLNDVTQAKLLSLLPGDLFPLEECTLRDSTKTNFEQILNGERAVVLFVDFQCKPCVDLLTFWDLRINPKLYPDIRQIVALRDIDPPIPAEYEGLLDDKMVVYYDTEHWKNYYNLVFWPAVVSVDGSGFVHHVQQGFEEFLEFEHVEYLTVPDAES